MAATAALVPRAESAVPDMARRRNRSKQAVAVGPTSMDITPRADAGAVYFESLSAKL
jgi:hypothetical protein